MRILAVLLSVVAVFVGLVAPVSAQDATPTAPTCDLDTMHTTVNTFIGIAKTLLDNKDPKDIANSLQDIADAANRLRATCDGLSFTGNKQKLIGPVDIPLGTYRAIVKTAGYAIVTVTAAGGQCGQGAYMNSRLFAIIDGGAKDGAETLFISQGCTAMIEVSNVQGDWILEFNNLTTGK